GFEPATDPSARTRQHGETMFPRVPPSSSLRASRSALRLPAGEAGLRRPPETSRGKELDPNPVAAPRAERAGFEPATDLSARTRFPVALLRPLGHLSGPRAEYPDRD